MRVFLLCVDALEYDFVKNRAYPHLKQKQFFKVHIPRRAMSVLRSGRLIPYTPVIWKAIFVGRIEQTEPQPIRNIPWKSEILNWLKSQNTVNRFYMFLLRRGIVKKGLPRRLGFKRRYPTLEDERTFISLSSRPIVIHNPLKADVRWDVKKWWDGFSFSEVMESRMTVFQKERQETLARIKHEWDLFIVYTKLLDVVGHLFWQKDDIVERYYQMIDTFAAEIQQNLSPEDLMMIVSDHGVETLPGTKHQGGQHSHHAYASFSHKIEVPQPLKITDLYPIVSTALRKNSYRSI